MQILIRYKKVLIIAFLVWLAVIIASGAGWNLFGIPWSFSNTGAFGDSFGIISAAMASIAALSAIEALQEQRHELKNNEERELQRDASDTKRVFETTFFNLLQMFERISSQTDIDRGASKNLKVGKDAYAYIVRQITISHDMNGNTYEVAYNYFFEKYLDDLAHYFRILYNIIHFVDNSEINDKYFYIKIIRAILSDSELVLLALNCMYHKEGRNNFLPLVKKYALLNNVSESSRKRYGLEALGGDVFERHGADGDSPRANLDD